MGDEHLEAIRKFVRKGRGAGVRLAPHQEETGRTSEPRGGLGIKQWRTGMLITQERAKGIVAEVDATGVAGKVGARKACISGR